MINTVYLDMDGVIVDFVRGINKELEISEYAKKWDWWTDNGFTFQDVNERCTFRFWRNLEWMHDGHDILREVAKYFKLEQIYLLTYPMPNIESPTGKWIWIRNNIPEYYKRTIITQASKTLLAKPDCLLIDDKDENVEEFIAAGGDAILVPRPWNKLHKDKDCAWFVVASELVKRTNGCKQL